MTVEEFTRQLEGLGEELNDLQTILTEIGGRVVDDLKNSAPVDDGNLRNSIRAIVGESELQIAMLNYGVFQNYGVDGTNRPVADGVPEFGIEPQPAAGNKFGFSGDYQMIGGDLPFGARVKIYQLGIKPQRFFDIADISELVADYVEQALIENNNLQ